MTDRYMKLPWAIPVPKTTATHIAVVARENLAMPYGIPNTNMTDSAPSFVSKFLAAMYASIRTKLSTTTVYHPQASSQVNK